MKFKFNKSEVEGGNSSRAKSFKNPKQKAINARTKKHNPKRIKIPKAKALTARDYPGGEVQPVCENSRDHNDFPRHCDNSNHPKGRKMHDENDDE